MRCVTQRVASTLGFLALAACAREEGTGSTCSCTFLTDFDDASSARVEVCAASLERAIDVAKGCAQSAAPAPVEGCRCDAVIGGGPCVVGECLAR